MLISCEYYNPIYFYDWFESDVNLLSDPIAQIQLLLLRKFLLADLLLFSQLHLVKFSYILLALFTCAL